MPIRPENKERYPKDWPAIRRRILDRAKNRCERCGVPNHAVGYREKDGSFFPLCGNGPCDAAGQGQRWPSLEPLSYAEALEFTEHYNDHKQGGRKCDGNGNHWIVIVLTIAHLDNCPENCGDGNLRAWCQRCHNRHDVEHRRKTRAARDVRAGQLLLPTAEAPHA